MTAVAPEDVPRLTRDRWARGDCLCCGSGLDDATEFGDDFVVTVVAEGVEMCGTCIYRRHDAEDVLPVLLGHLVEAP